jgi:hypothetical protein
MGGKHSFKAGETSLHGNDGLIPGRFDQHLLGGIGNGIHGGLSGRKAEAEARQRLDEASIWSSPVYWRGFTVTRSHGGSRDCERRRTFSGRENEGRKEEE